MVLQEIVGDTLPWPLNYVIPYTQAITVTRQFRGQDIGQVRILAGDSLSTPCRAALLPSTSGGAAARALHTAPLSLCLGTTAVAVHPLRPRCVVAHRSRARAR